MPNRAQQQPTLLPVVVVEEEEIDLVRIEKSLHSLGFFASTANKEISRTIVQVLRRPDGQKVQAKAIIEGIPSLGLPTTADRDKYMAFMKLALDQRETQGQLNNPVCFSGADMIKLLRLRKGGFHYDEINDWCKRMVATTIMSESSIFLADRKQYASDTFHVFDRVVLVGEELKDGTRSEFYQVYLSHWQLTNLNQGYMLPLDFNAYLKLRRDIAKALFGHLMVWFYASRGEPVEKNYTSLCQLLNIRAYPHHSKARSVLEPSLSELAEIGYLDSWDLVRTTRTGEFKLMLVPGKRLLSMPNLASLVSPEARALAEASLPAWVRELVARGVGERKARQLALDVQEDQPVMDQIEYAEHLIAQDRRNRARIANPAGFLIWAIEQNLYVPEEFETTDRRIQREQRAQSEYESRSRAYRVRDAYDEYCRTEMETELSRAYPGTALDTALKDQLRAIRHEQPEWFLRMPDSVRQDAALSRLRAAVRDNLHLPSFQQWTAKNPQMQMF